MAYLHSDNLFNAAFQLKLATTLNGELKEINSTRMTNIKRIKSITNAAFNVWNFALSARNKLTSALNKIMTARKRKLLTTLLILISRNYCYCLWKYLQRSRSLYTFFLIYKILVFVRNGVTDFCEIFSLILKLFFTPLSEKNVYG